MTAQQTRAYLTAGRAVFTVVSLATGARFTFRVKKTLQGGFRVEVLSGTNYTGIGTLNASGVFVKGAETLSAVAFNWLVHQVFGQGQKWHQAKVYHEGRCGRCGRALTTPDSIEAGLGPECRVLMGV